MLCHRCGRSGHIVQCCYALTHIDGYGIDDEDIVSVIMMMKTVMMM